MTVQIERPTLNPDALVERSERGELTPVDAARLIRATGTDLVNLMAAASALRDRHKGRTVTYSRKVFIPLTNLCREACGYCTFARPPGDPTAKTLSPEEVLAIAKAGRELGCKEALFSLGERPEERHALARRHLLQLGYASTVDYLVAMSRMVYEETGLFPHANLGILTHDELQKLRPYNASMGLMLESTSERLLEKGQAHYGCPGKVPSLRIETIETAGQLGIAFTTGILIGIGETLDERVDSLFALRDLHARSGNVQEVIIQNFRVKPDIRMRGNGEPSSLDMVRTIAVARLILGGAQNIQAPPNLAPDAYQFYLLAGINDWGGISPVTKDHINPERAWPMVEELRQASAKAGFELRERTCLYPEYLSRPEFRRERLANDLDALVDERGLVKLEATWH